jgi:hydrogenase expression/formation protein HypC
VLSSTRRFHYNHAVDGGVGLPPSRSRHAGRGRFEFRLELRMCLAVPGQIIDAREMEATVDLQGNRLTVSTVLVPEAGVGDWVLVHAGFAITQLDEAEARETWDYLRQAFPESFEEAGDNPVDTPAPGEPA